MTASGGAREPRLRGDDVREPRLRANDVRELGLAGSLLLAAGLAQRILESQFAKRPFLAVVITAFVLDYWARRAGARWAPVELDTRGQVVRRWLGGFGWGAGAALFAVACAAATGSAHVGLGSASAMGIGLTALHIVAQAFRDELLYRGIPLALIGNRLPPPWPIAFSTALGVAPVLAFSSGRIELPLLALASGLFFALTWQLGAGGFVAWAAHVGWLFVIQIVVNGAPLDVEWTRGALTSDNVAGGAPPYLAAHGFAAVTLALLARKRAERR
jgi:hypothetical protein